MTEHEQNWHTYYVLEARYKPHDVKWLELATYEHEQPAMDELENRIKKYGDKYDYRVIQRQEVQVKPRAKQETMKSLLITLDEAENYIKKFREHLQGEYDES